MINLNESSDCQSLSPGRPKPADWTYELTIFLYKWAHICLTYLDLDQLVMLKGIEEQTGIHYCMSSALYWLILFMLTSDGTSDSVNRFCQTVHFKPAQKRFAVFLRNAVVADIQTCQISLKRSSKNIQFIMVFILCH